MARRCGEIFFLDLVFSRAETDFPRQLLHFRGLPGGLHCQCLGGTVAGTTTRFTGAWWLDEERVLDGQIAQARCFGRVTAISTLILDLETRPGCLISLVS